MSYALVTLFLYLHHFIPWVFARPLVVIPICSVIILAWLSLHRPAACMLAVLLAFLLLIQAPGSISVDCDHGYVTVLYGKALQDSAMKKGRRGGFMMQAYAAGDGDALFSASGTVYISSDNSDVRYGDSISVHGAFSGPVFSAYSITLHHSPEIQSLRNRAVDIIRTRLRASGEAGELGMRLLLGYGERGFFSLSEDAAEAGLMHVLALSGMHLSILSSMISFSLFFLPLPFRMRFISIFLVLFSFLSGWRPSLVRALIFRFSLEYAEDRDTAFLLSFLILQIIFPYSCSDLGSVYSFISLGGIFMLSGPIDRGIRLILPVPKSLSSSFAASMAALLFSVPLTLDVFGCYQLGTVFTSFIASVLISLYMGLSMITLLFPPFGTVLETVYSGIEIFFSVSALFPVSEDYSGYIVLAIVSLSLIAIDIAYRLSSVRYVESQLQQHK